MEARSDRIKERDGYEFFTWKYKDNMEAGKDINYLKDGLIGFHIDTCIIRWDAWYAAMDYVVRSSMDDVQWKDRVVKQDMPTEYDRVDTLPGMVHTRNRQHAVCTFYLYFACLSEGCLGQYTNSTKAICIEKKHHMALEK